MSENGAKFYEATYSGEGIQEKEKYKFVVIKKVSHLLRSETIETETMHQTQYNKSDKTNHLITFAVDDACKDKLKKCIDSKLKDTPFDKENPQDFPSSLEEFNFESKDDFFYILGQRFNTLATSESEGGNNQLLQEIGIMEAWLNKWEHNASEFDKDKKTLGELSELKNKITENQGEGSKKEKSILNKFNEIKFQIILQIIDEEVGSLKNLQDKFEGAVPEYSNIQSLIKSFSSELQKLRKIKLNHKNAEKNIEKANILSDIVAEQSELYGDKFDESIDGLKAKIDVISNHLSALESLPLFLQSKKLLNKEFLDSKIGEFHEALKTKSLVELEKHAVFIETTFNIQLDLVKKDFVSVSKNTLAGIYDKICPYYDVEAAKPILQKIASLQAMITDFSPNNTTQFDLAIKEVNDCVSRATSFYNDISTNEGPEKTNLRPASYSVHSFFEKEEPTLAKIKKHGKKIQHGRWGADEKVKILEDIFTKANVIKSKYDALSQDSTVDKRKVIEIREDFFDLKQFVGSKQEALSRYRGISALQPLAKLWGGGMVTSKKYVNEIKEELDKLTNNESCLSLYSSL